MGLSSVDKILPTSNISVENLVGLSGITPIVISGNGGNVLDLVGFDGKDTNLICGYGNYASCFFDSREPLKFLQEVAQIMNPQNGECIIVDYLCTSSEALRKL